MSTYQDPNQQGSWEQPASPWPSQQSNPSAPEHAYQSPQYASPQYPSPQYPNTPYPAPQQYAYPGQPQPMQPQAPQQYAPTPAPPEPWPQQTLPPRYEYQPQQPQPQQFGQYGAPYAPAPAGPQAEPTDQGESTLANVALWLGILGGWLIVNLFVAIPAINETGPGRKRGREKALIGLACSFVWAVLLVGVSYAVFHNPVTVTAAPKPTFTNSADPGCVAAGDAVTAYQATVQKDLRTADTNLGGALLAGAAKSHVAASQLHRVGQDFIDLAGGTVDPTLNSDIAALNSACGLEFTYGGDKG